jgi:putative tricarboxylic transport membrane protein
MALILSGIYTLDHSLFQVGFVLAMGLVGYLMRRAGYPFLPLILGVVLGHMVESSYRRSLVLSGGDHRIFLEDPIAVGLLLVSFAFMAYSLWREFADSRRAKATPELKEGNT